MIINNMIISIYSCIYILTFIDVCNYFPDEKIPLYDCKENFTSQEDRLFSTKQFKT